MNFGNIFARRRRPRPPRPETVISRHIGKAIGGLIVAGAAALFGLNTKNSTADRSYRDSTKIEQNYVVSAESPNANLVAAINKKSELPYVQIKNAKVVKLLRADNKGARHQRWMVSIDNGITITVSHNIDLAEKVPLSVGDEIELAGELVFGSKLNDPILHWTHADPQKKRADGYVILHNKKYGEIVN